MTSVSHGALSAASASGNPHPAVFRGVSTQDIADVLGVHRAQVAGLRALTRPSIPKLRDPQSPKRTLVMYRLEETMSWLTRHLDLAEDQVTALHARARDFVPGRREEVAQ